MIFKGGSGAGREPLADPLLARAAQGRRHRVGPGELHAGRRRLGRHHQVGWQDPPGRQDGHPRRRPPRHRGLHLVQGHRGAQGPRPARRRLRHGPRRRGQPLASSTRTPTTRCGSPTSSCRPSWTTRDWELMAAHRTARWSRRCRPATSSARSPTPPGSAPTRACSSTPPSTAGTPPRTPAGSTARTPAREYMHLDNSACNLASLNLLTFLDDDDSFDVEGFKAAIEVVFTAQEILVGNADYPTEKIAENSRQFRQLGLGYANLGALLMAHGPALRLRRGSGLGGGDHRADDRPRLRDRRPHRGPHGPVRRLPENAEPMLNVLRMHRRRGVQDRRGARADRAALGAAQEAWDDAVELGRAVRRAQLAGLGAGADRHDRPDDGLRHHRDRARPRPRQDQEARRRRHDVDRQPDGARARCASSATRRARSTRSSPTSTRTSRSSARRTSQAEHLPVFACSMGDNTIHYIGPHPDDGRRPAVHLAAPSPRP